MAFSFLPPQLKQRPVQPQEETEDKGFERFLLDKFKGFQEPEMPSASDKVTAPYTPELAQKAQQERLYRLLHSPEGLPVSQWENLPPQTQTGLLDKDENVRPAPQFVEGQAVEGDRVVAFKGKEEPFQLRDIPAYKQAEDIAVGAATAPLFEVGGVGISVSDISALGLITYGAYQGGRALVQLFKGIGDPRLRLATVKGFDKWIAERSRGIPPAKFKTAQDILYNMIAKNRTAVQEQATNSMLARMKRGVNATKAAQEAVEEALQNFETTLLPKITVSNTAVPGQSMTLSEILTGITSKVPPSVQAVQGVKAELTPLPQELKGLVDNAKNLSKDEFIAQYQAGLSEQNLTRRETAQKIDAYIKRTLKITLEEFYDTYVKPVDFDGFRKPTAPKPITPEVTPTEAPVGEVAKQSIDEIMSAKYPQVNAFVSESRISDSIKLHTIEVPKGQRRKGIGTAYMEDLIAYADEAGKTITLSTGGRTGDIAKTKLIAFYKNLGFVENKGRKKDYRISDTMYRRPTQPTPTAPQISKKAPEAVSQGIAPSEPLTSKGNKALRQQIMATMKTKGIPATQYRQIFREKGGSNYLSQIGGKALNDILKTAQASRPVRIKQKSVIRQGTENAIKSLRQSLISDGQMSEDSYQAILKHQRLKIDKFVSPDKFITESEGRALLREMNYQAEVGLMGQDMAIQKALDANPAIKSAIDKVNTRIAKEGIEINSKSVKVSPLWDMRYYTQKLQTRTGGRFYDIWQMANLKHQANHTKQGLLMKEVENSTTAYKKIASDEKALQRISDYIEAKNKWSKIVSPADITQDEIKLANKIESVLLGFQPTVRYNRFKNSYSRNGDKIDRIMEDIPGAPREDIKEAIKIYESQGDKALREYLEPKTWGVIQSGYEPHIAVNPKLVTYKVKETVVGKGHLKSREGIELTKGDKTIINRTYSYIRQMLNLELERYLVEMDRIYGESLPKLADPYATKKHLQMAMNELKGYIMDDSPMLSAITKVASWGYTAVFLAPHLSFRNLFQNMAFHPDREALLNPANHKLTNEEKLYFHTYVSQQTNVAKDLLLQSELGNSRAARFARKITYYGYSDEVNRWASFWGSLNKAHRALRSYKKTGDIPNFINGSGLNDVTNIQRKEALQLLAQDKVTVEGIGEVSGEQASILYIAREVTNNTHFLYERAQRAPVEMGLTGRTVGSLLVFGRSVGQRMFNQVNTMSAGSKATSSQKLRASKILFGMIVFGLIAGELYKDITGKGTPIWKGETPGERAKFLLENNPYNPLNVLTWTPGGLAIGVVQDIGNVTRLLFQAAQGSTFAMSELTIALPRLGDVIVPFYGTLMNILESATDTQYIDRKALRDLRAKFDKDYMPNEEFYIKERGIIGQIQHALFSGDQPEPSDIEKAVSSIDEALPKIGKDDTEAKQKAIDGAKTSNEVTKAQEAEYTYTMTDLGSDIRRAVGSLDANNITEENGFSPIVNEYLESVPLIDEYFDQMADDRWEFREDNPRTEAILVIWRGYMKMSTPECRAIVLDFQQRYKIPDTAIAALAEPIPESTYTPYVPAYRPETPTQKPAEFRGFGVPETDRFGREKEPAFTGFRK